MRSTQTCPKCLGKRFAVTDEFRQPDQGSSNMTHPFPAFTIAGEHGFGRRETLGKFWTWICLGCGYTEFYAYDIEHVEELAKRFPDRLRIVDARPPTQGPYR